MIYDIFYVSKGKINLDEFSKFRQRYPSAQKIEKVMSYDDIKKKAFTKFFWVVWDDLVVAEDFNFDYRVSKWDEQYVHVFKNESYYDGICLIPKTASFSQKEFFNRFFVNNKKEIDVVASHSKPFDVFFISYNEKHADENYKRLLERIPYAKRVNGVKGIHLAHLEAANQASTDMFWVVDADAIVEDSFQFKIDYVPYYDRVGRINLNSTVHVWLSKNPVNDLVYGYGGVKLLPKRLTMNMDIHNPDMTTSISDRFKIVYEVSNITAFNTDEFSTWRSAFRECAKLASRVIDRNYEDETDERLYIWCNVGKDKPFGKYAIHGARAGKQFGEEHMQDPAGLNKINDYDWLYEQFKFLAGKL